MKRKSLPLWAKILLLVFINVFLVCWFYAWQVLRASQTLLLENAYRSALQAQSMLCDNIQSFCENILSLSNSNQYTLSPDKLVQDAAASYHDRYLGDTAFCTILSSGGSVLYSGADGGNFRQLTPPKDGAVVYQLQKGEEISEEQDDGKSYIAAASFITVEEKAYQVHYWEDVTGLLNEQKSYAYGAAWLLMGVSAVLAVSLYFIVRHALKPLEELGTQARTMAAGDYTGRVEVRNTDEVGKLAADFNHMAEAVRVRTEMLENTARDRERYAANLAHEIKSPMTSIIGYTEIGMLLQPDPEKLFEMLSYINREGKRLDSLASALLQWSRLNQGPEIKTRPFSAERLAGHIRQITGPLLEESGQELRIAREAEVITGEEDLILTLLRNLIANASAASPRQGKIWLTIKKEGQAVLMSVKDRGMGMEESEIEKVTEPFYMIDKARTRSKQGSGLGLALCRSIAEVHRGTMKITSTVGEGTTVTVTLPQPE